MRSIRCGLLLPLQRYLSRAAAVLKLTNRSRRPFRVWARGEPGEPCGGAKSPRTEIDTSGVHTRACPVLLAVDILNLIREEAAAIRPLTTSFL